MQKKTVRLIFLVLSVFLLTGCQGSSGNRATGYVDGRNFGGLAATTTAEPETARLEAAYSGTCFGIVVALDTDAGTIAIQDINTSRNTEYTYSGGTYITDKYGNSIAMTQIKLGDIVEGGYDAGDLRMKSLMKSDRAWENRKVTNFSLDRSARTMRIGNTLYEYNNNLAIFCDGEQIGSPSEISDQDELWVSGYNHTVYSIIITKGHGYVTLENSDYLMDGIVTVGGKIAQKITPNMILVVPEGEYILEVAKDGLGGSQMIKVEKNQEILVDVSSFKEAAAQIGSVSFTIKPEGAKLYIDEEETDYSGLVELLYDAYKIRVEADGYVTYAGDLLISSSFQKREITLGKPDEMESTSEPESESQKETESTSNTTASSQETTGSAQTTTASTEASQSTIETPTATTPTITMPTVTAPQVATPQVPTAPTASSEKESSSAGETEEAKEVTDYKIHVEAPVGASVYFDGEFKGIAPVSFQKISGEHTIVLRQNGYTAKTYTVNISGGKSDSHYSYPGLIPE